MTYPGAHGEIEETVSLDSALKPLSFSHCILLSQRKVLEAERTAIAEQSEDYFNTFKLHCIFINLELKIYVC